MNLIHNRNKQMQIYLCRLACKYWQTCHRTGDSAVATGAEGADGVCVLIMYCSGAAYLNKNDPNGHEDIIHILKERSMNNN